MIWDVCQSTLSECRRSPYALLPGSGPLDSSVRRPHSADLLSDPCPAIRAKVEGRPSCSEPFKVWNQNLVTAGKSYKANRLNQIIQTPSRCDQAVRISEQRSLRALKRRATNLERLDGNGSICITRTSAQISHGMAYCPSGHHPLSPSFKPGPGWTYQPCPACWRAPHLEWRPCAERTRSRAFGERGPPISVKAPMSSRTEEFSLLGVAVYLFLIL
jgi:hypothetical protein